MTLERENYLYQVFFDAIATACENGKLQGEEWKSYESTTVSKIVAGLALKSTRHCMAAYNNFHQGFMEEAVILIRSAYETTITMDYHYHFPEEKNNYLCWSDVTDYRNYAMWPRISNIQLETKAEGAAVSFGESLEQMKANIATEIETHTDIDREWLRQLNQDSTNIPAYKKLLEMIAKREEKLQELGNVDDLLGNELIRFQIYRNGSSVVHSNWMAILKYYLKPPGIHGPEITKQSCLWAILAICEQNIVTLFRCNYLGKEVYDALYLEGQELRSLLKEIYKSE